MCHIVIFCNFLYKNNMIDDAPDPVSKSEVVAFVSAIAVAFFLALILSFVAHNQDVARQQNGGDSSPTSFPIVP